MKSCKSHSLWLSFIAILVVAAVVGCGSDSTPPVTGVFTGKVIVYGTQTAANPGGTAMPGVEVTAINNATGVARTETGMVQTSGTDGAVSFTFTGTDLIALKIKGGKFGTTYFIDSYQFNMKPDSKNVVLYFLDYGTYVLSIGLAGNLPAYNADLGAKGILGGKLYWVDPTDATGAEIPVGCATIEISPAGGKVSYYGDKYPSAAATKTNANNGQFSAVSLTPGTVTLTAFDANHTQIGSRTVFIFPTGTYDKDTTTTPGEVIPVPSGQNGAINLTSIYVDSGHATNPGCAL